MFNPSHLIYQFADYHDEVDDYLPHTEWLIEKWSTSDSPVQFQNAFQVQIACLLLHDDLLPSPAVKGLSFSVLDAMAEARDKRFRIAAMKIEPPTPGRKRDYNKYHYYWGVRELLERGVSKGEAYAVIAEKYSKSPDTIRRVFERAEKRRRDRDAKTSKTTPATGNSKNDFPADNST